MVKQVDASLLWLALALAASSMLHTCAEPAHAQDTLVRDVLRLAFHESPADPLADAAGIHAVLVNGAARRHTTPHHFARWHSRRFFAGRTGQAYLLELDVDCHRPRGFPTHWPLETCRAVVALVSALDRPVCPAVWWGSELDYRSGPHARAHARDVFVDCGQTRNLFSRPHA